MALNKQTALTTIRDPFALLRQLTTDFDRAFDTTGLRWPAVHPRAGGEGAAWFPEIDVFEQENRLITKVDLPGLKKEDVKVEISEGNLVISGERKTEREEKTENVYRCEREFGRFYRAVPLPEGAELEKIEANFANGVLEVIVPVAAKGEVKTRKVEINDTPTVAKAA